MMNIFKITIFSLIFCFSHSVFSCGTAANWMDTFEGKKVGNNWRDNMNQREALTMLYVCGTDTMLDKAIQTRMAKVLSNAISNKFMIHRLPASNSDIRNSVENYNGLIAYDGLIESIYRRYGCLQGIRSSEDGKSTSVATLVYDYFGEAHCPGHNEQYIKIATDIGANLHLVPKGKIVASLKKGTQLKLLGSAGDWYRVLNPSNDGEQGVLITYIHKSGVDTVEL